MQSVDAPSSMGERFVTDGPCVLVGAVMPAPRWAIGGGMTHVRGGRQPLFPRLPDPSRVDSGPQAWTCSASATVLATRARALYVDSSGLS
jgi:hypothetical protein